MHTNRKPTYLPEKQDGDFFADIGSTIEVLISVIEGVYDGIYITNGNATTIYVNQSYLVISGLEKSMVMGKNMEDLMRSGVISRSGTLLALKRRTTVSLEQEFTTGKRALVTSTPIFDNENRVVMVVTSVRDLSGLYALRKELDKSSEQAERYYAEVELLRRQVLDESGVVAAAPAMLEVLEIAKRVAQLDTPVLLLGETGVGKERIASYVFNQSNRNKQNFIKVNCGAIPENLIESELFGYDPGAFTGAASKGKIGYFGVADKGTIFFDEIGDLSLSAQVKLLRVLQEQEIVRVGGNKPIKIDVRILAATNGDLAQLVRQGKFREDLYYRLSVFPIKIPPLRKRQEDIILLARHMLAELNQKYNKSKRFTAAAERDMQAYAWPGNVRELKNVVERAFIMSNDSAVSITELNPEPGQPVLPPIAETQVTSLKAVLEQYEASFIQKAYQEHGNIRDAAKSLGMDATTFNRKRNKYEPLHQK